MSLRRMVAAGTATGCIAMLAGLAWEVRAIVRAERAAMVAASSEPVPAIALPLSWNPAPSRSEPVSAEAASSSSASAETAFAPPAAADLSLRAESRSSESVQPIDREPPTPPSIVAGEAISPTEIRLTWRGATDDVGVTHYEVLSGDVVVLETSSPHATLAGLEPATEHCLKVRAYDAAGTHSRTTPPLCIRTADSHPPAPPQDVVVTALGPSHVMVRWAVTGDDGAIARYELLRKGEVVATATGVRADELGVEPGQRQCYRVVAVRTSGSRSEPSDESCTVTPEAPPADSSADVPAYLPEPRRTPAAPRRLLAIPNSRTAIVLAWREGGGEVRATTYDVLRDGGVVGTTSAMHWLDRELSPATRHCYAVRGYGASSTPSSDSNVVCATPLDGSAPGAPFEVEATRETRDIRLTWQPSRPDVVYRIQDARGRPLGTTSALTYRVVDAPRRRDPVEPCFTVIAVDTDGRESAPSDRACVDPVPVRSASIAP